MEPTALSRSVSTSLERVRVGAGCGAPAAGKRGDKAARPGTRWNVSLQGLFSIQDLSLFLRHFTSMVFQHIPAPESVFGTLAAPTPDLEAFLWASAGRPLLGALCSPPIPPTLALHPCYSPAYSCPLSSYTCVILSLQTQTRLHNLKKAVTSGPVSKPPLCYLGVLCPVCSAGIFTPWSQILSEGGEALYLTKASDHTWLLQLSVKLRVVIGAFSTLWAGSEQAVVRD